MRRRLVRDFLDMVILYRLRNVQCAMGYDVLKYVQRKYHVSLSPGTFYSTLYSMERRGFVKGECKSTRRYYSTTAKGEELARTVETNLDFLVDLVASLLS